MAMRRDLSSRAILRGVGTVALALAAATAAVWAAEAWLRVPNASAIYVVAVAVTALVAGAPGAITASIGAFLLYDYFFVDPRFTFTVSEPGEWLTLVLLVFVGVLVGQLAVLQRGQTHTARNREREARALFNVIRELATRTSTVDALPRISAALVEETRASRAWVDMVDGTGARHMVTDTDPASPRPAPRTQYVLRRTPGDVPAEWVAIHTGRGGAAGRTSQPTAGRAEQAPPPEAEEVVVHRVGMDVGGRTVGALSVVMPRPAGRPDRTETRLMAAAADQIGQALEQDRLAREAQEVEIARRSDQLKTALLESVSHDLRTPLASIRAAAGSLMDRSLDLPAEDRFADAEMIDREAEHLNRVVTNLLDLSRVEAGALRVDLDACDLADLVETAFERVRRRMASRVVRIDLDDAPPVDVDPALFDQVIANLLENVAKYADAGARVRIWARRDERPEWVVLTIEDSGPGVPAVALPRLFDKFYRVPGRSAGSRSGTGVGLAVVRGLVEAMGGTVDARMGDLGGLAVDVTLPAAPARDAAARDAAPSSDGTSRPEPPPDLQATAPEEATDASATAEGRP